MKAKIVLVSILLLFCLLTAPAYAVVSLLASEPSINETGDIGVENRRHGVFVQGNDEYLYQVQFQFENYTTVANVSMWVELWNASSDESINDTGVVESSDTVVINPSGCTLYTFTFDATSLLNASSYYYLVYNYSGAITGTLRMCSATAGTHIVYYSGSWQSASNTPIFYAYTESEESGEGEYTPGEWYVPSSYDELIENFVAFVVPVAIIFLPAFLLCFITRRWDKWLILIGITIGVGLGFYFGMVPLWLVFLITIGLIGMAYQSVRGGG